MSVLETRIFGCLVCDEGRLFPLYDNLLRCPSCGFVTARMETGSSSVRHIYEGDYFKGTEYLDYEADEAILRKNFQRRLQAVLKRRSSGRLLEIGAAYGFFLDVAKKHFNVVGYEVNEEAARYGQSHFGVDIRTSEFLDTQVENIGGPPDVTVMWDVIEHLERPDLYIERIAKLSKRGGLLYITTGDIGSWVARRRGPHWRLIHPPSHLHYFDRKTITKMLARYHYKVVEIKSVGYARSFLQVFYSILVLRLGRARAYELVKKTVPPHWGFTLNLGDIMQVVAERM